MGGRVELADKRGVVLRIVAPERSAPELPIDLTLAQAALKGDKTDDIVRDSVMLGVTAVQPLLTRFIDVPAGPLAVARRVERWQRVAVSSVKQCGRSVVPEVAPPAALTTCLASARESELALCLWEGTAPPLATACAAAGRPRRVAVLVGPEGGLDPVEVEAATAAGWRLASLGPRILRTETAGATIVAILQWRFGDMGSAT